MHRHVPRSAEGLLLTACLNCPYVNGSDRIIIEYYFFRFNFLTVFCFNYDLLGFSVAQSTRNLKGLHEAEATIVGPDLVLHAQHVVACFPEEAAIILYKLLSESVLRID